MSPQLIRDFRSRFGRVGVALASTLVVVVLALVGFGLQRFLRPTAGDPDAPAVEPPTIVPPAPSGPDWFEDRTAGSGLDFTYRNGEEADQYTILESLGGGVALFDYDGDGRLDIFVTGGGTFTGPAKTEITGLPCRLYRNLGGWKFQDVTTAAGLDRPWFYTHGVAVADFDRDGRPDLLVTGYGSVRLFRNVDGRRFEDVTERMNLKDDSWSTSAGWADINGNGFPDLYVCHYVDWSFANNPVCQAFVRNVERDVCPPARFKPLVHALFENDRGMRFREVGSRHQFRATGCGLGVVLGDVNSDGRPDVYVANDATNNFLFLNRDGRLDEVGWRAGVAVDETGRFNGSMGTDLGDYDGSGRASIWVTNFQGEMHALYRNLGRAAPNEAFDYQSRSAGVAVLGTHLVSFGTAFLDADGDGWQDLAFVSGHVLRYPSLGSPFRQKPALLRNVERNGRRAFEDVSDRGGSYFRTPALGRGLAVGDLDNDGRPDLVISHSNSPVSLLRNVAAEAAPTSQWLGLRLTGRDHRDLVGSTVTLDLGSRKLTRFVKGGGSYLSAHDPRLLFGFNANEKIERLTVRWSWGETQTWEKIAPGGYRELREGDAVVRDWPAPR